MLIVETQTPFAKQPYWVKITGDEKIGAEYLPQRLKTSRYAPLYGAYGSKWESPGEEDVLAESRSFPRRSSERRELVRLARLLGHIAREGKVPSWELLRRERVAAGLSQYHAGRLVKEGDALLKWLECGEKEEKEEARVASLRQAIADSLPADSIAG